MSIIIALALILVFFLLVGKFANCCYQRCSTSTNMYQPYYATRHPIYIITNTTSSPRLQHMSHSARANAVTSRPASIEIGETDFGLHPSPPEYHRALSFPTPRSCYDDPPPSYEEVCGITTTSMHTNTKLEKYNGDEII